MVQILHSETDDLCASATVILRVSCVDTLPLSVSEAKDATPTPLAMHININAYDMNESRAEEYMWGRWLYSIILRDWQHGKEAVACTISVLHCIWSNDVLGCTSTSSAVSRNPQLGCSVFSKNTSRITEPALPWHCMIGSAHLLVPHSGYLGLR
jgi:hypothetical protein